MLTALGFPTFGRTDRRTFLYALVLYTLVLIPILIADRYNVDDWGRVVLGYSNWDRDGRPLAEFVMDSLALGKPIIDFSPLCQIAAILSLSSISVFLSRKYAIDRPFIAACATLPLGANPFFLANLSFKFDSLPMALSVLFALLPTLQCEEASRRRVLPLVFGCASLIGSLCLYQASLNAFLIFAILEYIFLQMRNAPGRELLVLIGKRAGQLVIAACVYKLAAFLTIREGYGAENSRLITDIRLLGVIWRNLIDSWSVLLESLWRLKWPLLLPVAVALLISLIVGIRYHRPFANRSWIRALFWMVIPLITPVALVLATFGFMILLASPARGIRTFVGFGALLSCSIIVIISLMSLLRMPRIWQCVLLAIPTYVMIFFAAVYGNALKTQKEYEEHIARRLADDLKELVAVRLVDHLILDGTVGYAPSVERVAKKYHALNSLVQIDLHGDESGFGNTVLRYYGLKLERETSESKRAGILANLSDDEALRANIYYQVYIVANEVVVRLLPVSSKGP